MENLFMHICIVTSSKIPPEDGIGYYVFNLAKKLIEKNQKVTIITRGNWKPYQIEYFEGIKTIKVLFLPIYPIYMHLHSFFVNFIFKKNEYQFDMVHVHSPLAPFIKTTLPIILTVHTTSFMEAKMIEELNFHSLIFKKFAKYISYPIENSLVKRANLITVVAESVKNELNEYEIGGKQVLNFGNGVNEKEFCPPAFKNDMEYILFVGRLSYRKGLFDLFEASKLVLNRYPNFKFYIVGKGFFKRYLDKNIARSDLADHFILKGYIGKKELIYLYQNATIFVLPSHYEGLPTVILEAMACGLPIVATNISGNVEIIKNNINGLLIDPKNPRQMYDAISKLLEDKKIRMELGKKARITIEEKYTWDIISSKFLKIFFNSLKK